MWIKYRLPAPVPFVAVVSYICLAVLMIPVPVRLTIQSTGTLIPVTRSLTKDFVDMKMGWKPPVRHRSTMPPKQQTDPLPAPANDEAPVRRFLLREAEREGFKTDSQYVSWMFARNIGPFALSNPLVHRILCHRVRYPPIHNILPGASPFPCLCARPFPSLITDHH